MDGSAYNRMGEGLLGLFVLVVLLLLIFVPLGVWKAVELVIKLLSHIS